MPLGMEPGMTPACVAPCCCAILPHAVCILLAWPTAAMHATQLLLRPAMQASQGMTLSTMWHACSQKHGGSSAQLVGNDPHAHTCQHLRSQLLRMLACMHKHAELLRAGANLPAHAQHASCQRSTFLSACMHQCEPHLGLHLALDLVHCVVLQTLDRVGVLVQSQSNLVHLVARVQQARAQASAAIRAIRNSTVNRLLLRVVLVLHDWICCIRWWVLLPRACCWELGRRDCGWVAWGRRVCLLSTMLLAPRARGLAVRIAHVLTSTVSLCCF